MTGSPRRRVLSVIPSASRPAPRAPDPRRLRSRPAPDQVEDLQHVGRPAPAFVDDEVRVALAHRRAAPAGPLEAEVVDDLPGVSARRVLEDTPGVPPAGWLRTRWCCKLPDLRSERVGVPLTEADGDRGPRPRRRGSRSRDSGTASLRVAPVAPVLVVHDDLPEDVADGEAVGAGVHHGRASHRARNPHGALDAAPPGPAAAHHGADDVGPALGGDDAVVSDPYVGHVAGVDDQLVQALRRRPRGSSRRRGRGGDAQVLPRLQGLSQLLAVSGGRP